jgi:hypothetical protein
MPLTQKVRMYRQLYPILHDRFSRIQPVLTPVAKG